MTQLFFFIVASSFFSPQKCFVQSGGKSHPAEKCLTDYPMTRPVASKVVGAIYADYHGPTLTHFRILSEAIESM